MLMFGGGSYTERNDLWELTLAGTATWSQLVFPTQAPLRLGHTAIYDTLRDRMIVFGGANPSRQNDTWVLTLSSGSAWSQLATTGTPPPPVTLHSAIYDPVRDRMLVFGGYQDSGYLNGVWALSLSETPTWTMLAPVGTAPAPRREHSAIYDPVGDRMIVFGGTNGGYLGDVWALNLSGTPAWELIAVTGGPTARSGHSAIYDPSRHLMWVFAGRGGSGILNDLWTLTLGASPAWASAAPVGPLPAVRVYHTAVLDRARDRMVVFSGYNGGLPGDTWFLSLGPTPAWYALGAGPTTTPAPVFTAEPSLPASIVLGQTLTISASVRNDGTASDDGRISVGFPQLVDPADGQWVNSPSAGDAPGFQVYAAGSLVPGTGCQALAASYLVAQYADDNWLSSGLETNAFSVTVEPRATGPFTIELRSSMHTAGASCNWINALPSGGSPGFVDQQGWAVHRYTVNVLPAPTAPEPTFTSQSWIPQSIEIGQSIQLSFSVRNAGAASDDGRISISFPSLTNPGDGQWVTSSSAGDTPGFVEIAAGGSLSGSDCQPRTAGYLVAEYADDDWAWVNTETNTFTLQVTPQALGDFSIDVRSSMHRIGAGCDWTNGVPGGDGEIGHVDQQGFAVTRYTVQVTPTSPPVPIFTGLTTNPATIRLGDTFEVHAWVRNNGWSSDDGRISFGFPSLTDAGDGQWTSSTSTGDTPGYVERPAGSLLTTAQCQSMTAGYLVVEYQDDLWEYYELNEAAVTVQPQAVGTFMFEMRSTMHKQGGATCDVVGAVPLAGEPGVDQQGWTVRRYAVTVLPPEPDPAFTANVSVPAAVDLGQPLTVTMSVRNDGSTTDDGRISVSFPSLTDSADVRWVSSASNGDTPGAVVTPAGGALSGLGCQPITASYAAAEYRDDDWAGHGTEVNTFVVNVRPQVAGTFDIYVRATMRKTGSACELFNALPANGASGFVDQQGFEVKKFTVTVNAAQPIGIWFDQGGPVYPPTVALGQAFTLSQKVTLNGGISDDGRIAFSFPAFTQPSDVQWVTSTSTGDLPGYVESPAGSTVPDAYCEPFTASYLIAEYVDDGWNGGIQESNVFTLSVRPQAVGTFYFFARVTIHQPGQECIYHNTVPPTGQDGFVDQQGHVVRRYAVEVVHPDPTFVGPVEVVPASIPLGQSFAITGTVRNDGTAGISGEICFGFPALTGEDGYLYVASNVVGSFSEGYSTMPPNRTVSNAQCQTMTTSYYHGSLYDDDWLPGETNTITLTVTPQSPGPFPVDVHSFMRRWGVGLCESESELPPNGDSGYTDEKGFAVKRFTVDVVGPTAVTSGDRAVLELVGAEPNPARGDLMVSFSLPGPEPATLELFDLRGRLVARRGVGALGTGRHRVTLTDGRELPVGVYLVRLTRGDQALDAKVCLLK